MQKPVVLLVEDEPHLARVIKDSLEQTGYTVLYAADGEEAYQAALSQHIDVCVVDVMLPRTDGFTLVRRIRSRHERLPVLFMTARTATEDVVKGYESGGNDYLKKPFGLEELFYRIKELLKRTGPGSDGVCLIGEYTFLPDRQVLQRPGSPDVRLSYREAQLLQMLYRSKNNLLYRKDALVTLWGEDNFFHGRTMDVFITKLRKHLQQDPAVEIVNIRGWGYKLVC